MRRLLAAWLLGSAALTAQTNPSEKIVDFNQNGWYVYNGDHKVSSRWGIHFDGQLRRANTITRWQQYMVRPGVNFHVNDKVTLSAGYAYIRTYPYGNYPVRTAFPEHRIYEQVTVRTPGQRLAFSQRFRLEQRFIRYPTPPGQGLTYQNRLRYLIRTDVPLVKDQKGTNIWYLPIQNEVFLGIAPNYGARPFDQNRLGIGVGRSLGKAGNLEVGYLNQFLGQRNGRIFEFDNTLNVTFSSTFDLSTLWK